jgi:adenine-specific DNA-methyltransferase
MATRPPADPPEAEAYQHPTAESLLRPDVGTQAQFRKKKPPVTYRYDSSLSPALDWDGQNPAREQGETLIKQMLDSKSLEEAKAAASKLKAMSKPFLNWAGKAERLSFDVPTLPLFIHERLSTKAIIETLKGHKRDKQLDFMDLFGDPQHSIADQVLRAYEHRDQWVNRMILGDSLVVMNSLLHYEGLGGQVQMIYMDPPYGVRFGSNFQPFVRKREVKHNDDDSMTREPEMVQAYRDTWEVGLHSYLTYMRDRLLMCRELLAPTGSIFVQISDENVHHVRELMDEIYGEGNFIAEIAFQKTGGQNPKFISSIFDVLLWYAKDKERAKPRPLFILHSQPDSSDPNYVHLELEDGTLRPMTPEERRREVPLPIGSRVFRYGPIASSGVSGTDQRFEFQGEAYLPPANAHWKTNVEGLGRLASNGRILQSGKGLAYKLYWSDFCAERLPNLWTDTQSGGFNDPQVYSVQTTNKVIERCILLATDPGDLVLDPTCGSGTTARVAEQWGRRWITIDVSRVPLALARQRLLTATFDYYELNDDARGPASGFVYHRKQNKKGEEVGGIIPHIKLEHIANDEPPEEEVLVDRPEEDKKVTRVCGPFVFEGTIPTPVDWEGDGVEDSGVPAEAHATFVDRMLEVLRHSPVLRLAGNRTVTLKSIRPPTKSLSLSAEAMVEATAPGQAPTLEDAVREAAEKDGRVLPGLTARPVAFVFGPENGAVSEKLVYEAAKEANAKAYTHLYVIGFSIQPNARKLVEECEAAMGISATYVQATPDLMMGDLLKNMRSSQIFSVCGLPEVKLTKAKDKEGATQYQVELLGLDLFDPIEMKPEHLSADDVPAWLLDTDYNGLCFHVSQAFFPRTGAWESLKKALRATYEESVWDHLAGTVSAPFEAGEHGQVAVKVIDDRGNELLVVKNLKEAER